MEDMTVASLFAGMGGFAQGVIDANFSHVWANELNSEACTTFRENHPKTRLIEKNIKNLSVTGDDLTPVDLLTAGFPCQPFSQAGERSGFHDPRGGLFHEIIRLLEEFGSARPAVVLLENVPFLQIGEGGRWFDVIRDELQLAGYWFNNEHAQVMNTARTTGIPQERDRLFMVAFSAEIFRSNRFKFPPQEASRLPLSNFLDLGSVHDERYYLSETNRYYHQIMKSIEEGNKNSLYQYRKYFVRPIAEGVCPTLTANMGRGGHNVPFVLDNDRLRKLTEYECARLQGFDETYQFPEEVAHIHRYAQIGNTVTVPVVTAIATEIRKCIELQRSTLG